MTRLPRRNPCGAFVLAVALALGFGCSSIVPPETRVVAPIDSSMPATLYVVTNDEGETLFASLRRAGFTLVRDPRESNAALNVRFGSWRARRSCGQVRNVVYDLRLNGVRVAVIKGRGWTGSCSPNILGAMSSELARLFKGDR